jgi:hypothetical protein
MSSELVALLATTLTVLGLSAWGLAGCGGEAAPCVLAGPTCDSMDVLYEKQPYDGYIYRVLTKQGPDAPLGRYDYFTNGKMIGGFGLVAFPAKWGNSGVMTFIVNQQGIVFQKDLGPNTTALGAAMTEYNPGQGWKPAEVAVEESIGKN